MPTFEYCSLSYLNQWLAYDRIYCEALSKKNTDEVKSNALKNAAVFYGVARNLPREYDVDKKLNRYQPILKILDSVDNNTFNEGLIKKIQAVEKKISKAYGNRGVLSLTTKFLWLKIKHPILIYDSQAKKALGEPDNLEEYYTEWRKEFKKNKNNIEKVCSELPKLYLYTISPKDLKKEEIRSLTKQTWFHERVFDIYLWNKGKMINQIKSSSKNLY